ncbi:MAG: cytochrome C [Candidatus Binatia bacterium]
MGKNLVKTQTYLFVGIIAATVCFGAAHVRADDVGFIKKDRTRQGVRIAPVPLDLHRKDKGLVKLGSYLVNAVGGCNDCHTWPNYKEGGDPFQGQPEQINTDNYLAGGRPFGPFISANLTPDAEGKPAGLTRDEFIKLMRTGYDEDEGRLLQVMPWPVYRNMTDKDLRAIYEYLSAIPHAEPSTP